ncbi:MAG TPA: filament integrity protein fraC [Cyanobacteria bacterium UBA12227]|nr:filament integrity protein fraC [Cyanobacteria bacterium UBA12227]HAX87936.1 filament integrity protein fraC [Cyanobacteria bacterium UBA11370]HBY79694.1 filament integrity protein fraC [Cyanobacteria bacterium UBA11148]
MRETVLPLEMILFQVLFLVIAIALEARIFYRKLRISRKTSVEYAMFVNLLATGIGWLTFFAVQNLLSQALKAQVISYIFFDRLFDPQLSQWNSVIIAVGIAIFFLTFFIKLIGLELLQVVLDRVPERSNSTSKLVRKRPRLLHGIEQVNKNSPPNTGLVVLLANAYSYSAILLLLVLRFLQFNSLT